MRHLLATLLFVGVLLGAALAAPPAPNRVVMILKDGTSVGGELVEATPASVTIKANAKAPPITRPWSAIKQLSNGVTRASIVAKWRASQSELLCDACTGDGTTICTTCTGKGVDPATAAACAKCEGDGTTGACKTPRCVDGKVPCPENCLKPSDFHGAPDKEGKRWKKFPAKAGGFFTFSDAHVGHLIVREGDAWNDAGVCPRCGGKSVTDDPACNGTGKQTCATCKGKGVVGSPCPTCKDGAIVCATCAGTGLKSSATQPAKGVR